MSSKHVVEIIYPKGKMEITMVFPNLNRCSCGGTFKDTLEKIPVNGCFSDDPLQKEFHVGYDVTQRCSDCHKLRETMTA